ncbi:MAG: SDR family oxidoreductase [Propionibacteriaceae bacterium]|jgi:NAD(P)-dependent dehydrogenase (short-subunit alcohol dehydrogenase family)|nr:SDR family oxidoreductase [Propionibacteriaceae bacterium]
MPVNTFPTERTAILTGAASPRGIGIATAAQLAREGWSIAIIDLDDTAAKAAAAQIGGQYGVAAYGIGADVTDENAVDVAITAIEAALPPTVALVNLAGISSPTDFMEETVAGWERVFKVNVTGTFIVIQRVLRGMIERRLGRIVAMSSISAQRGGGTFSKSAYSASKGAIIGLIRSVAREMGQYGITANCVAPGAVDTDIMGGTLSAERKAAMSEGILVGRVGDRAEVAALISYLVGEHAGYVTAATYDINGGLQIS